MPRKITIQWTLDEATADVLAQILESAEHDQRKIRCDPNNPANAPYLELNRLGEHLAGRVSGNTVNIHPPVTYYQPGIECPGCTGSNWLIGRQSAECGHCHYVLPLKGERL